MSDRSGKVVITGGLGFLGKLLVDAIQVRGELRNAHGETVEVTQVLVVDSAANPSPSWTGTGVKIELGDIRNPEFVASVIRGPVACVFHLASMVSSECEERFDDAFAVNVRGTTNVLNACRLLDKPARIVFASSFAVFGGPAVRSVVDDATKATPETTYGCTKAISELLVNDYTRKGYVDGRAARLPTVIVRPGRPNAAASSWVSGIFREPLAGQKTVVPVPLETRVPVSGYRAIVENLLTLHDADGIQLGPDRTCLLPAICPSAADMIASVERVVPASDRLISIQPNEAIARIFNGWAQVSKATRAVELGMRADTSLDMIIDEYKADFAGSAS